MFSCLTENIRNKIKHIKINALYTWDKNNGGLNMTCKDCVHQEACFDWCRGFVETTELCEHFKDKSKFIELPCKVGDKVWFIKFMWNYAKQPIPAMVCGIKTFSSSGTFTFTALTDENNVARSFINQDIGKTVFLTYEAAEKALKEREQND